MTAKNQQQTIHTILGAGGAIGQELHKELKGAGHRVRLVRRSAGTESDSMAADLTRADEAMAAVEGSDVVYLLLGLPYNASVWQEQWPRVMRHTLEACKRHQAKLIFFDNVYMYGRVQGPMTENTPFNPCSKKGEVRARIATELLQETKKGDLQALIARSADFYGPNAANGIANALVFDQLVKKGKALCLADDQTKHSYVYTPDAARSLLHLATADDVWNQTWHVPTAPNPYSGQAFIASAAQALGLKPKSFVLRKWMTRLGGFLSPMMREIDEMLYQNESDYIVDSSKICQRFQIKATPYDLGIKATAQATLAKKT